jgi:hypothetical protein
MAGPGVGTGIGIGIGHALSSIGQGWSAYTEKQREEREKRADALHQQAHDYAVNTLLPALDAKGYRLDGGSRQLIDLKTGAPAQGVDAGTQSLVNEYLGYFDRYKGLFPADQPNALMQHFRKMMGRQQGVAKPNPRATEITPGGVAGEAPAPQNTFLRDTNNEIAGLMQMGGISREEATKRVLAKRGLDQATSTPKYTSKDIGQPFYREETGGVKPGVFQLRELTNPETGKTFDVTAPVHGVPRSAVETPQLPKATVSHKEGDIWKITDPNTAKEYGPWNIDEPGTPPAIKAEYASIIKGEQEAQERKAAEEEEKQNRIDRRAAMTRSFQEDMLIQRLANAKELKDYGEVAKIRGEADSRYTKMLDLSNFADRVSNDRTAAQDKLLAGRLIKESDGRFNPAQYDNLVHGAGLGNTFEQWKNNVTSGKLTDEIRKQIVDAAHALLASAKDTRDTIRQSSPDASSGGGKTITVSPEDMK